MDVSWLAEAMNKAGYKYQKNLAKDAGVSPATIGNALKKGEVRKSTAEKIQKACGEHAIGPFVDKNKKHQAPGDYIAPPELNAESCIERFEGSDCPTTPATCSGCWNKLRDLKESSELPMNRAVCRTQHGWFSKGGVLLYRSPKGNIKTARDLIQEDSN